jgi:hypothetical protein
VLGCPSLPAKVLSQLKTICFLTFESKNERKHLVMILNNWHLESVLMISSLWRWGIHCCSPRRWSHHPHLHNGVIGGSLLLAWGRRRDVVVRAFYLLHARGRRSASAAAARASHLLARGRRSGAARGKSEPPIAVLDLLLHEPRMLANHGWLNVWKTTTCLAILICTKHA